MRYPVILALTAAVSLVACGKREDAAAPAPMDAAVTFKNNCASCHGLNGQGIAAYPKLAGNAAGVIKTKLMDYKAGKQMGPQTAVMAQIAVRLSDSEIDALARYVATLK